jgi:hypothetical protein
MTLDKLLNILTGNQYLPGEAYGPQASSINELSYGGRTHPKNARNLGNG